MNHHLLDVAIPNDWDRRGLPGWAYHSDALLELEKEHVFRNHWQIAGHVSDVQEAGDYLTMDVVGERALVVRGKDGEVRAFHNICRHRGSRVVADNQGNCKNALVCPFHGWVYNLDGTLRGAARPRSFPDLDKTEFGLVPLELEIWNGLIFIRFRKGPQPSVAELMAPVAEELGHYKFAEMVPSYGIWSQTTPVNWKSVRDVDNEGYHVAMAHPALQDLYGSTYFDEPFVNGVSRSFATYNPHAGRRWSVRNYVKLAPEATHLPEHLRKAWVYYGMFPNMVISVMPESVQFYQEFPLSTGETLLRGAIYKHRDETREQAAARYLSFRIDRETMSEDVQLSVWSNESMLSQAFEGFYLSDLEYGVRTHHDHLRAMLPVLGLESAPDEKDMANLNDALRSRG
ncbi:MAG: aromatic ring-hydroxylating dioxygenase subunit alpha [Alphaproteobacteria bacterium]|nr:aromatic ring-hydroxylating dioxygenase subunit alpha [Alphaproteobacteria bacterium]MBU0805545.1 aromatic ring-hydroxylating dioxygenase subunit alpha [Alphaproteobacteria bacterium]MBU0873491.1 aromatic ring-hydroxylating dioxygenase subunit alpha [Alphaproteobacteria bacterium]MBU1401281.1 aromatic ring-hydroxylating dioxygenase subunit alpha [Alphaproteobacteria bacterium]MBU1592302.1 aromatic ring-hydroxylating dioxygenase subunit alpha [Alphaproteobacteria bacterium]